MSSEISKVLKTLSNNQQAALERLFAFLAIPSVSTDPAFKADCQRAAEWAAADLRSMGFAASVRPTTGHPMVVGHYKSKSAGNNAPHILFYGHYDVQPPDPLTLWETPPFEPTLKDHATHGKIIVARGASDDKGQVMTFFEAARAWLETAHDLPVDVTVFLEGEEECGSPSLMPFLAANEAELKADFALVCDTDQRDPETPAIITRLRGMAFVEVEIETANRDLHSGLYGGPALNPIRVLTQLLGGIHGKDGRILIPGFYEGIKPPDEAVLQQWRNIGFDIDAFLGDVGLAHPAGEDGHSALEQLWARPTAEINGIWGGYTGPGVKTVIPAKAHAKLSFRLVPEQDPEHVLQCFKSYVKDRLPQDAKVRFSGEEGSPAIVFDTHQPLYRTAAEVLEEEFGKAAIFAGSGASIPIVEVFKTKLGMDSLLMGFALDDDMIHAPNEKYNLKSFEKGARAWARLLGRLAG